MDFDRTVGVVVGLQAEARIARRLGWQVAVGGGTAAGAVTAAEHLAANGVQGLVSFGLAGGLDPSLSPGTVIVPGSVLIDGACQPTDPELSRLLGGATPHMILAADAVVASVEHKRRLHQGSGAAAVDLESGAVARVGLAHGIAFAVLRAVCDPAHRALPPAAGTSLDASGGIAVWRVLASLLTQPGQLPALVALARDAALARRALAARVMRIAPVPSERHR